MSYKIPPAVKIGFDGRVIPSASKDRVKYWRVTIPATKTAEGKKVRRFFDTEKEAKSWIDDMEKEIANRGKEAFAISDSLRHEALQCWKRLHPHNATLTQAVDYFLKHSRPDGGKKTFREVGDEFMTSRISTNRRARTLANYRSFLNVANEQWGEKLVNEIRLPEIEMWVAESEWEPRTRRNYLASMSAVLGFAQGRKYCLENEAKKATRPELDQKEVEILTPEEAAILLEGCQLFAPGLLPAIVIGMFAGIRVKETLSLSWSKIDLENRHITINSKDAKKRERRVVTINDTLLAWLQIIKDRTGYILPQVTDPSRPVSSSGFSDRRLDLLKAIARHREQNGLPPALVKWPGNGLRHSFGSYFLAQSKNENLTSAEMGNSPDEVHRDYKALVKPAAVTQYWGIIPSVGCTNVIRMTQAA